LGVSEGVGVIFLFLLPSQIEDQNSQQQYTKGGRQDNQQSGFALFFYILAVKVIDVHIRHFIAGFGLY
jgi:hypothetical protein